MSIAEEVWIDMEKQLAPRLQSEGFDADKAKVVISISKPVFMVGYLAGVKDAHLAMKLPK